MCGIAGTFHLDPRAACAHENDERVRRIAGALVHRGPDDSGFASGARFGLGFRRLSILDLSAAGNQPQGTADGAILSIVNGEIYNYKALRDELTQQGVTLRSSGDAEVVPHLYRIHGDLFLEKLEGMFSIAVVDVAKGRLLLARDRFGKKPLYYRLDGGRLDFASEPKGLLASGDLAVEPDAAALVRYLTFGYVPSGGSAFAGMKRLRPGERLVASESGVEVARWYRVPERQPEPLPDIQRCVELWSALLDSVRDRLASDVPLGVFLSGGIDSGLILAAARQIRRQGVRAFTIGFEDPLLDERPLARATAKHLGVELIEHVARPDANAALDAVASAFDEPFGDSSAYPTLLVSELARRDVTVALSGDGGDEVFAGYQRYRALRDAARLDGYLPKFLRRPLARAYGEAGNGVAGRSRSGQLHRFVAALGLDAPERNAYWSTFFGAPLRSRFLHPELIARASPGLDPDVEAAKEFRRAWGSPLRRALRVDLDRYLPDDLLVKTDTASMAHSLEVRCPWLDRRVVEMSLPLTDAQLIKRRKTKHLPRLLASAKLPPEVARAAKRGFGVPLADWLRGPLKATVEERLASPRFAARRLLKDGAARELIDRHTSGREDWSSHLWLLLVLDAWFRRFVDRAP